MEGVDIENLLDLQIRSSGDLGGLLTHFWPA